MKIRSRFLVVLLAGLLGLATPAVASDRFVLHAIGAEITVGTGAAVDLGNWRNLTVHARVTAGSGTVNPFDLWLECSADGTNFTECAIDDRVKATTTGGGTFTDNTIKLIAEVAVTTSAVYSARVTSVPQFIRARWNIAGTTPSETFELVAVGR